jgi:uncharacterized protein
MNNLTAPLVLNVGFISQQSIGYSRVFFFDLPELVFQPDLKLRKVVGEIKFSRTSEGLLAQGKFRALVDAICGRCLGDFEQVLKIDFTELFTFASHLSEDTELVYPEDGQIDFGPIVREYMILEIPINPVCKEDCKGLCSVCGNNLNSEPCDHELDSIDPRMAVLKSLLDK